MKVTLEEVRTIFRELINGKVSREYAVEWAKIRQDAEDASELEYEPRQEEARIWEGIIYLLGVDLKDNPHSYSHTKEDFVAYYKQTILNTDS